MIMAKEKEAAIENGNELVKAENSLPISADFLSELQEDGGKGFEGVKASDVAIPYYGILQAMSPQVKRGPQQIVGAEEGDIFNTVTQEVIKSDVGIVSVPCVFQKAYVEWKPRDGGGGFVKQHPDELILNSTEKDQKGNNVLPNGNHIVETAYHYIIRIKEDGTIERAIISMTSTQLRSSRRWLAQQMGLQLNVGGKIFNPPPFSHSYLMKTVLQQKDQYVWSGWDIGHAQLLREKYVYDIAKKFASDIQGGLVKVAPPPSDSPMEGGTVDHDAF